MALSLILATLIVAAPSPLIPKVKQATEAEIGNLVELYKYIHSHPELSTQEEQTAKRLAQELRAIGFTVTENVGGHGLVGIFKNGDGPTVMVRTDMDALPVVEQTGVNFASKVRTRDRNGNTVGVMHACGHDIHMSYWVGSARVLVKLKDQWSGTLMFIAQPSEEIGLGARQMIEDGLFTKFPKPDYALAIHADALKPVGTIAYTEGLAMANVDSVDVTVRGVGGHGAAPHNGIDPIVLAARIVLDLQTIVSREVEPGVPAVVTVGSIHGGTKHNIIPNEVQLQLTVRTTTDETRDHVLKAIDRIAKSAATGAGAPAPSVKVNLEEYTPSTFNDVKLTQSTVKVLKNLLGDENVQPRPVIMGGEDFGRYGRAGVPICMYFLGTIPKEKYVASKKENAEPLPGMHSDRYIPLPEPSIRIGVESMTLAVIDLLKKK